MQSLIVSSEGALTGTSFLVSLGFWDSIFAQIGVVLSAVAIVLAFGKDVYDMRMRSVPRTVDADGSALVEIQEAIYVHTSLYARQVRVFLPSIAGVVFLLYIVFGFLLVLVLLDVEFVTEILSQEILEVIVTLVNLGILTALSYIILIASIARVFTAGSRNANGDVS